MTRQSKAPPADNSTDFARAFWRSVVADTCMLCAGLHGIVPPGTKGLENLPDNVRDVMGRYCNELVDSLCHDERTRGRRRHDDEQSANRRIWNALKPFRTDKVPPLRGEASVFHFDDDVPRGTSG